MRLHHFLKFFSFLILTMNSLSASASSRAFQQIETDKAQELARGRGVVVAVIDTGIDVHHPDLRQSLWINPGESGLDGSGQDKSTNGIDDDGNGLIDDLHGWNFVTDSKDLTDSIGHGTHIAGLIAGKKSSEFGTQGVAPESRLMILKYYDPKASPQKNIQNSIRAIRYAIDNKAQIINFSGGGPGSHRDEEAILRRAEDLGVLVVAAAGNEGLNTDRRKYYPADYALSNILSVSALNPQGQLASYSNFSRETLSLAAPGTDLRSTLPDGSWGEMTGTSQATAVTSGAAALLLSQNLSLTPQILIQRLAAGGLPEASLLGKTKFSARLNIFRSLIMRSSQESAADVLWEDSEKTLDSKLYTLNLRDLDDRRGFRQSRIAERPTTP